MPGVRIGLDEALDLTRTGDVWLFRGHTAADRAIQLTTNSPVNHVGMSVVLDDLPALMWHAELGRSLPDLWSGGRHRGAQLHDLRAAVTLWATRYGQRAWLRQLEPPADRAMEMRCCAPSRGWTARRFRPRPRSPPGGCAGGCRPAGEAVATPPWKPPTAPRSWPSLTRPWACCRPGGRRTGMTLAGSGAGTTSACPQEPGSAGRSPSRFPPRSSPQLMTDRPQSAGIRHALVMPTAGRCRYSHAAEPSASAALRARWKAGVAGSG